MDLTDLQWGKLAPKYGKPYAGTGRHHQDAYMFPNGLL